jgi:hypothetical protein
MYIKYNIVVDVALQKTLDAKRLVFADIVDIISGNTTTLSSGTVTTSGSSQYNNITLVQPLTHYSSAKSYAVFKVPSHIQPSASGYFVLMFHNVYPTVEAFHMYMSVLNEYTAGDDPFTKAPTSATADVLGGSSTTAPSNYVGCVDMIGTTPVKLIITNNMCLIACDSTKISGNSSTFNSYNGYVNATIPGKYYAYTTPTGVNGNNTQFPNGGALLTTCKYNRTPNGTIRMPYITSLGNVHPLNPILNGNQYYTADITNTQKDASFDNVLTALPVTFTCNCNGFIIPNYNLDGCGILALPTYTNYNDLISKDNDINITINNKSYVLSTLMTSNYNAIDWLLAIPKD